MMALAILFLSREKAKRIKMWQELEAAMNSKEVVKGIVTGSVKGGMTVDIGVIKAFLAWITSRC